MRIPTYHSYSSMCQRLRPRRIFFSDDFHFPSRVHKKTKQSDSVYDDWLASRELAGHKGTYLVPGTQRPITLRNAQLAYSLSQKCAVDFFKVLWALNPCRTTLMMTLNIVRSLFPAFRGYSQALIIDEIQALVRSGSFTWSRFLWLVSTEIFRRVIESLLDSIASSNENIVLGSARFFVDYQQLQHRVRLDIPTLSDPAVRDLLQESDHFARSFTGGGFGLLSPLDFVHILAYITEIFSHLFLILSLTGGATHFLILLFSIFSTTLPTLVSRFGFFQSQMDTSYTAQESRAADRQEKMRNLAYSDVHRAEVALFGLGDWILKSWSSARKITISSEQPVSVRDSFISQINFSDFLFALQNIPLVLLLQSSSASLGSLTIYRSSIQAIVYAFGNLITTTRMAFQGIFLMSAFCASMKLKPQLQPKDDEMVSYKSLPGGMSIDVRGLSYTYPGSKEPALRNVQFSLAPGETLAIVGYNGSGKSTLAKILLRVADFDHGSLLVNGVDIRRYTPAEYHRHLTAVFQGFSKFNSTVKENVGLGNVEKLKSREAIETAVHLAEADTIVESLPEGLRTMLETPGFESLSYAGSSHGAYLSSSSTHHGLSGGEWQRIAIARSFMRASDPQVDLLLFDEPTSSLDAHAQNQIFDTIDKLSRSPSGERSKNVIFITHRLSTARRADKVAMMENGTISEFGTHQELMKKNGSYAALYNASI